ncbi:MAG: response regulator transcription factor [Bacteroidales bacterium]|nr:response regulator transcription factor [Bacteroidales bacterium]MDD3908101.1 response regulator transcription factor [Bacteroidales bacterium]MDD4712780.1 response regulator transcription factor [Bacteroidales bacterium]
MIKILLVEDDEVLGYIIKEGMELIGDYEVCWANTPKDGLKDFDEFMPDIVVSDVEMPGMTGLEMVKLIREKNQNIPIILETCVSSSKVILEAYQIGIDNYIKKPFLPEELHAYIQGLLKRLANKPIKTLEDFTNIGNLKFNVKQQFLITPTQKIELSIRESVLLDLLFKNQGQLITKETIAEQVWGGTQYLNNQSLDVFMHNLRKYLSEDPNIKIKTLRSVGYILEILSR